MQLRARCRSLTHADFPEVIEIPGRYRDVDARLHINNIAIAEMFSEARSRFVRMLAADLDRMNGQFFVVGQQAVLYVGEARFPGRIDVGSGLFAVGRSSLRFGQGFFSNGHCVAIAEAVLVFSSQARAIPLPTELRERAHRFLFTGTGPPRQLQALE
jgi:acyl-CoA thioester hydrolase